MRVSWFRVSRNHDEFNGTSIYANSIPRKCYVIILIVMIMIVMTGWLIEYTICFGKYFSCHAAKFLVDIYEAMSIYVLCTWKSYMEECN